MAEAIRSALLLDYESLDRSLNGAEGKGDTRLADRAAAWLAAIETGRLIGPEGTHRRLAVKRCYAGPAVRGKQRDALSAAGFEVIDVASSDAGLHIAMDTIDALGKPNGPDEYIVLVAGSELAPLLTRLKSSKRQTTIYADAATAARDKALADTILDGKAFAAFLASNETPVAGQAPAGGGAGFRAEIEAFARRIHAATNIPLFSPKTYAELFKHLTDEIRANGYHFQTTAKNVAERMTETGRSVTRRQVVFIVKGLALKGHVFSTGDSPDGLAEVFREQARYLITNAGITIDPGQERLLNAWFVSSAAPPPPAAARIEPARPAQSAQPARPVEEPQYDDDEDEAEEAAAAAPRPQPAPASAAPPPKPQARPTAAAKAPPPAPVRPAPARPEPARPEPTSTVKPVELPKSAAKPIVAPQPIRTPALPLAREEAKAVIAARIAASARLKPGSKPGTAGKAAPRQNPPGASRAMGDAAAHALESSILAAIAEAVDVLVEDDEEIEAQAPAPREPAPRARPANGPAPAPPQKQPPAPQAAPADDDGEGGDIGDQIQRIIASYTRNRDDE